MTALDQLPLRHPRLARGAIARPKCAHRSAPKRTLCWGGRNWTFQSDAQRHWLEAMAERGWTVPDWPKDYGGGGLSAPRRGC